MGETLNKLKKALYSDAFKGNTIGGYYLPTGY